jgi:16S rRNA (guanine527-N7)-methyltransferase
VKRADAVAEALARHGAVSEAVSSIERILDALDDEPDPQTTVPPEEWVEVHVADSLAGLTAPGVREAGSIADIGSGAGFPGLVLAAVRPHAGIDLIESARRKARLAERLIEAGGLQNASAVAARAEEWARSEPSGYDVVTARALAPLAVLAEYAAPLLRLGGRLVAWKGARDPHEESAGAAAAVQLGLRPADVLPVTPYPRSRNRHLHVYEKVSETPAGFPRRPGMALKRPLA